MCCKQTQLEVAIPTNVFVDHGNRYVSTTSGLGQLTLRVYLFVGGRELKD